MFDARPRHRVVRLKHSPRFRPVLSGQARPVELRQGDRRFGNLGLLCRTVTVTILLSDGASMCGTPGNTSSYRVLTLGCTVNETLPAVPVILPLTMTSFLPWSWPRYTVSLASPSLLFLRFVSLPLMTSFWPR